MIPIHKNQRTQADGRFKGRPFEFASVGLFVLCNLLLPLVFEELYPFTIVPMFRDRPQLYADYQVFGPDGAELPVEAFHLQRNYWGSPVQVGAGIELRPSLDRFGHAPDRDRLSSHVHAILTARHPDLDFVDLVQTVIGPIDSQTVGVMYQNRIRVYRKVD